MRCYFHLVNSHEVIPDDAGIDVSDMEAMQFFAQQAIEDMRSEVIELGECLVAERCWDQVRWAIEEYTWRFDGLRRRAPRRRRT
jgi:hypothetical protein